MNVRENVSTLQRNLVVSYDDGEQLGHVTNVFFDKPSCRIKGISLSSHFIPGEQERFVDFKAIHRLGKTVVIISNHSALKDVPKKTSISSLRMLKKTNVVTEEGEHLGELQDVNVVAKSGIISEIMLFGAKKLKVDVEKDKISIGPDMIIVPGTYRQRIEEIELPPQESFVANASKKTRSVTESIKTAVFGAPEPEKKKPQSPASKSADTKGGTTKKAADTKKATDPEKTTDTKKAADTKPATDTQKASGAKKAAPDAKKATDLKKDPEASNKPPAKKSLVKKAVPKK